MKRTLLRTLAAVALALIATAPVQATHLVGGNLGYVYQGETAPGSGLYRYQVYLEFYLNCGPNSNFQSLYELLGEDYGTPLFVGAYLQDPQNPNADKIKLQDIPVFLTDSLVIEPDLPDNCAVGQGLCTVKGTFVGQVDVPLNFGGLHLYYHMCCRNLDIDNLNNPNGTGIGYYAFVPPPLVNNSSPVFLGQPTPFLCIGDTATFLNSASDPDGDLLIFSFEIPYNSQNFGGGIIPPPATLTWPVNEVNYNPGFSLAQPFGAGGYAFINGATGLTRYMAPLQGNFVVAVEVKEFRNGQLIGRTRRDLQLQSIPCPPNATPAASTPIAASYTVQAGDQLCIDLAFDDADGDSLFLQAAGTIFDGNLTNPPATIGSPVEGDGTVGTQFCWSTACDQGQAQPYLFSVSVTDNGCPPLTIDVVVQVQVLPFAAQGPITGPVQVCTNTTGAAYSLPQGTGAGYAWTVTGGTLAGGNGTNAITVDWGAPGSGQVSVIVTDSLGCAAPPLTLDVTIAALPTANAGPDAVICAGDTVDLGGTPTGPPGSTFAWSPATGLSSTGAANPQAFPSATTTYIVQVNNGGCTNTDTVRVVVSQPQLDAGPDVALCVGDTVQLNATGTGSFLWTPAASLSDATAEDPLAFPTSTTNYSVTLTDSVGCTVTDQVLVTVNALPFANAGPDRQVCPLQGAPLTGAPTGPPGATFLWSPATGLNDPTLGAPIATPSVNTTYVVQVTDVNGCTNTDTVNVEVLAAPPVDAGPDLTICAGDTAQVLGGGGTAVNIEWTPANSGLSDESILNPLAFPGSTTTYVLWVQDINNCTATDTMTVFVNALPNADAGPDVALCLGGSAQLDGSGGTSYLWSPAAGLDDATAEDPVATVNGTTTYSVLVTDGNGCSATDSVTVTVNLPVNAGTDGSATLCSDGTSVDLNTLLGGTPDAGGTWSPSATYTPGSGGGVFSYVVAAQSPCVNDTAFVTIAEVTAPDAGSDATLDLCSTNTPVDLFSVLGGADPGGVWTDPNGVPFSGVFDPALWPGGSICTYFVPAQPPCTADTATVVVTVTTALDPGGSAIVNLCSSGASFSLTDSLTGTPDPAGTWSDPNNAPHGDVYDPAVDEPGVYTFSIAAQGGCPDTSATVTVTELAPPADAGADLTLCIGDTAQLNATGGPDYSWSPGTGLSATDIADPLAFPTGTTTYTLTVTDAQGCAASDAVTVTVNALPVVDAGADAAICAGTTTTLGGSPTAPPGSTILWSPGGGLSDPNVGNPTALPGATTTYIVGVQGPNGCVNSDTVTVTVNPLPVMSAGNDTTICTGASVQLDGSGTGSFLWTPSTGLSDPAVEDPIASPTGTTTYTLTVTDANQCSASDDVTVSVGSLPTAEAGPDVWVCPGFDVQLQGSGGTDYSWSPTAGLNDPTSASPLAAPSSTTIYTLTVTDAAGCSGTDQVTVTVNDDPPVDAGPDQTACFGNAVVIGGAPSSIPGSTFLWLPGSGLDDPTAANPTATPTTTTLYTLVVTNDTCTAQDQVLVTIAGEAQAAFTVRLEPRCDGLRAYVTDLSQGAVSWQWTFSDGTTSTEPQPSPVLPYGGDLTVTLTITDAQGCTASITQNYPAGTLDDHTDITVPNIFTPNGDGNNDLFGPITDAELGGCLQMSIFNRWGQKMWESLGNATRWDGRTFAGEPAVVGTYFYVMDLNGVRYEGSIQLMR
ncbi:MAG: gliding motility-associated C-terminal domain-containing protein [Flavobacteriales bacterium]|nr:gliding motility-associated C-terminal domain-containing protein [Flavobacteriales bacterium]